MADQSCATAPPMLLPALVFLLDIISGSVCIPQTRIVAREEQTRGLKESLSLTDAQAAKILKIYGDWEEEMSNVLGSGDGNRVTKGEALLECTSSKSNGQNLTFAKRCFEQWIVIDYKASSISTSCV